MENEAKRSGNETTHQGYEWVEAESGNVYICPAGSIGDKAKASEDDLRRACVDASANPQND